MKNRVFTSVAVLAVMLLSVIFSKYIVYPFVISLLAVTAVFEILRVIGSHNKLALALPAYLIAAIFPISAYFCGNEYTLNFILALAACMFVYLIWLFGVSIFSRGSIPFSKICEVFGAVTYVSVSFSSLALLRYINSEYGVFLVVLVFVISWVCDTAAFAVGSLIGKHKLIPEISPKKTVEGAVGGVAFTALLCGAYGLLLDTFMKNMHVNYLYLFLFGMVLSVVSQLGDLAASLIKREYGAKDYGKILPGHGGVMDRFDSVMAVSTILLILSLVFPPFTVA